MHPVSRTDAKKQLQDRQRDWLRQLVLQTGNKPSQIAKKAGVSDTTLTRLLNNPDYSGTLSEVTVERIKSAYTVPGPSQVVSRGASMLIGEAERIDLSSLDVEASAALRAFLLNRDQVEFWKIGTSTLERAGYLPGDFVVVDPALEPRPHDAVKATVFDWNRGGSETVWRLYDPPFLISSTSHGHASKPLLVDGERVKVQGVIVACVRPHRHAVMV